MRHARGQQIARHPHRQAFAALALSGHYVEAGDTGLHRVAPGEVVFHAAHERHLDRFGCAGAEVLVLPLDDRWHGAAHARVVDPDRIARVAERDIAAAVCELQATLLPAGDAAGADDWPAHLARALLADPDLSLQRWAGAHALHRGSLSRGFRRMFEVSPHAFRLHARTHAALRLVRADAMSGAHIAHACGFADQAHMSRALRALTGTTATRLRLRAPADEA